MPACNLRDHRRLLATPIGINLLRIDLALDLYAKNPFRLLVAPAWLGDEQRDARVQRFRNLYKLRPEAAMKDVLRLGYEELAEIRDPIGLLNDLREPPRRLIWELFWPHLKQEDFDNISANKILTIPKKVQSSPALPTVAEKTVALLEQKSPGAGDNFDPLSTGEYERIATLCQRNGPELIKAHAFEDQHLGFQDFALDKLTELALWTHTQAILHHNRALAIELSITNVLTEPKRARSYRLGADEHWRKSLDYWASTAINPIFWEYLKSRVIVLDDPRLKPSYLEPLRNKLPEAILAFNAALLRAYVGAGCKEDAARHMRLIGTNSFHLPAQRSIMVGLLREVANAWLSPLIQQMDHQRPQQPVPWQEVRNWLMPILEAAEKLPIEIKENFAIDEITLAEMQFDNLAERMFNGINSDVLDYQSSSPKTLLFLILLCRKILALPLSASLRRTVEERRGEYIESLYGRCYANPHQARQLDPTECWFLPGELADPEVSILLPVYKMSATKGMTSVAHAQDVLIPRSRLAENLHLGEIPDISERRQAEIEKLILMIEETTKEAERDRQRVESACATALAEEDAYRMTRTQIFDGELAPTENSLQTQIKTVEEHFQPRMSEVETRLMAARAAAVERLAPALASAQKTLARLEPWARLTRINFPVAGAVAGALALSLSTFSAAKAWTLHYLLPLELSLRTRFHASDQMVDYLPIIVAILLTTLISIAFTEIILSKKAHTARRALEKIEERQQESFAWVDQVIDEQRNEVLIEQEAQIKTQRAQLAVITEQRTNFFQEMEQVVANVKTRHQQELERKQDFDDRLAQLKKRLESYMIPPKASDSRGDFPAYSEALKNGYLPGERPNKSENKITNMRKPKLWPF